MNSVNFLRGLKLAAMASVVAFVAPAALAQQAQTPRPAGQAPRPAAPAAAPAAGSAVVNLKPDPNQAEWTKVCGQDPATKRETCYTTRDFVAENDTPVLAVAVYETKGEGNKVERQVRYLLPLTFLLQPGIRTSIDGGQPVAGRYTICVQNGCFAEFTAADAVFAKMKTGTNLVIQVQNQAAREVSFNMPLAGFAKGVDGAPVDPRVLEEAQKKLQEEMQRKSDEIRKQIQGNTPAVPGAAPAPAGAPPAAGAPVAPKP
jgi:invasion protein IalB